MYHPKAMADVKVFCGQTNGQAKNYMPLMYRCGGIETKIHTTPLSATCWLALPTEIMSTACILFLFVIALTVPNLACCLRTSLGGLATLSTKASLAVLTVNITRM